MAPLLECAGPGELWLADRNFCTSTILLGWHQAQASFIVREHGRSSPPLASSGPWVDAARIETGQVREQRIDLKSGLQGWRRIELQLDQPTEASDTVIRLWTLPAAVGAHEIARYIASAGVKACSSDSSRCCKARSAPWVIRGPRCWVLPSRCWRTTCWPRSSAVLKLPMLQPMKPVQRHPRSRRITLPCRFAASMRACSSRCRRNEWSHWSDATPDVIAGKLLELAHCVDPAQVRTRRRGPKTRKPAPYVEGAVARAHHSTARLLKRAKGGTS